MKPETRAKLERLGYNGSAEVQHKALMTVLGRGIVNEQLKEQIIDELPLETIEEIIQFEYC